MPSKEHELHTSVNVNMMLLLQPANTDNITVMQAAVDNNNNDRLTAFDPGQPG